MTSTTASGVSAAVAAAVKRSRSASLPAAINRASAPGSSSDTRVDTRARSWAAASPGSLWIDSASRLRPGQHAGRGMRVGDPPRERGRHILHGLAARGARVVSVERQPRELEPEQLAPATGLLCRIVAGPVVPKPQPIVPGRLQRYVGPLGAPGQGEAKRPLSSARLRRQSGQQLIELGRCHADSMRSEAIR